MRKLLRRFWREERGCVVAMEWVFVASILTLSALAGLWAVQHAEQSGETEPLAALIR
jgi:hypothetical protein